MRALPCRQCENSAERGDEDQEVVERPMVGSTILYRGVAQFGSALGSGPRGRGFKSRHLDHKKTLLFCNVFFVFSSALNPRPHKNQGPRKSQGTKRARFLGERSRRARTRALPCRQCENSAESGDEGSSPVTSTIKKTLLFCNVFFVFAGRIEPTTSQNGTIFPQKAVCI